MRNIGIPRREPPERRIDWVSFIVTMALVLVILMQFKVIAKYIFG